MESIRLMNISKIDSLNIQKQIGKLAVIILILMQTASFGYLKKVADDFTYRDLNGDIQNLFSYLDAGKYVLIEYSTPF